MACPRFFRANASCSTEIIMAWIDELEAKLHTHWNPGQQFRLEDVCAACEEALQQLYPENRHVKEISHQFLQQLRDTGRLEFVDDARTYRLRPADRAPGHLPIPACSRDDLIRAMRQIDSSLRDTAEWERWEDNNSHKVAILFEGRRYAVSR